MLSQISLVVLLVTLLLLHCVPRVLGCAHTTRRTHRPKHLTKIAAKHTNNGSLGDLRGWVLGAGWPSGDDPESHTQWSILVTINKTPQARAQPVSRHLQFYGIACISGAAVGPGFDR